MKLKIFLLLPLLNLSNLFAFEVKGPARTEIGFRFQSVARNLETKSTQGTKKREENLYLSRARVEVEVDWGNGFTQSLDIRNDDVNFEDKGVGNFELGNAYFKKVLNQGNFQHDFRVFKAKLDVSRTQTASSARLLYLNRPHSSDFASNYISQNRRSMNLQWNGSYKKALTWHFVIGDGTNSNDFNDALGNSVDSISEKRLVYGSKLRAYLWGKKQKSLDETFFNDDDFFSIGAGVFHQPRVIFKRGAQESTNDRTLANIELTLNYGDIRLMAEYFSFSKVHPNFSNSLDALGRGEAFYIQSEVMLTKKLSSFLRYENWDRVKSEKAYELNNYVAGFNYYYLRNTIKFGIYGDHEVNGSAFTQERKITSVLLTSMLHF